MISSQVVWYYIITQGDPRSPSRITTWQDHRIEDTLNKVQSKFIQSSIFFLLLSSQLYNAVIYHQWVRKCDLFDWLDILTCNKETEDIIITSYASKPLSRPVPISPQRFTTLEVVVSMESYSLVPASHKWSLPHYISPSS